MSSPLRQAGFVTLLFCGASLGCQRGAGPKPVESTGTTQFSIEGDEDSGERYGSGSTLDKAPQLSDSAPGAAYLKKLEEVIGPAWASFSDDCRNRLPADHPLNAQNLQVALDIVLDEAGTIQRVELASRSGNAEFDGVAKEIAQELGRLPVAPSQWVSDDSRVYIRWSFASDQRQASAAFAEVKARTLPVAEAVPLLLAKGRTQAALERILAGNVAAEAGQFLLRDVARVILSKTCTQEQPDDIRLALETIGHARFDFLVKHVRGAVQSPEPTIAIAAIEALGQMGAEEDRDLLLTIAREAPDKTARAAAQSLLTLGGGKLLSDITPLSSKEPHQRAAAVAVFSVVESEAAVPRLIEIAQSAEGDRRQRLAALAALGFQAIKSVQARKHLVSAINSSDASTRRAALWALSDAGDKGMRSRSVYWKVVAMLKDKDHEVAAAAISAAARLEPSRFSRELPGLVGKKAMERRGSTAKRLSAVDWSLLRVLHKMEKLSATTHLIHLASHDDPSVRILVAKALLNQKKSPSANQALLILVRDEDPRVRAAALPVITDADALRPLLEQDSSPIVQTVALSALVGRFGLQATAKITMQKLIAADSTASQARWIHAWIGVH